MKIYTGKGLFYYLCTYKILCRKAALDYGLWEQIRVDCGKEFFLALFNEKFVNSMAHQIWHVLHKHLPLMYNKTSMKMELIGIFLLESDC